MDSFLSFLLPLLSQYWLPPSETKAYPSIQWIIQQMLIEFLVSVSAGFGGRCWKHSTRCYCWDLGKRAGSRAESQWKEMWAISGTQIVNLPTWIGLKIARRPQETWLSGGLLPWTSCTIWAVLKSLWLAIHWRPIPCSLSTILLAEEMQGSLPLPLLPPPLYLPCWE